jgi:integral membrane protein
VIGRKGWIVLRWFRLVAVAEACSWAGLLVGMFFKYVTETGELGVKVFGPIHGALFVLYAAGVLLSAREAGWSRGTAVLGLACAVPPFTSVWFERRMAARTATAAAAT